MKAGGPQHKHATAICSCFIRAPIPKSPHLSHNNTVPCPTSFHKKSTLSMLWSSRTIDVAWCLLAVACTSTDSPATSRSRGSTCLLKMEEPLPWPLVGLTTATCPECRDLAAGWQEGQRPVQGPWPCLQGMQSGTRKEGGGEGRVVFSGAGWIWSKAHAE